MVVQRTGGTHKYCAHAEIVDNMPVIRLHDEALGMIVEVKLLPGFAVIHRYCEAAIHAEYRLGSEMVQMSPAFRLVGDLANVVEPFYIKW